MSISIQDTIEKTITVRAPRERVFAAITNAELLVKWFPDAVDGSLEPGENPVFTFDGYGRHRIHVVAVDPVEYFAYRWAPYISADDGGHLGDVLAVENTLVEFRLEEVDRGTVVRLKESGFKGLPLEVQEKKFTENNGGWDYMMGRLDKLFASE